MGELHPPRLRSQTESRYVQTVPDGKCLCPDRPRRKVPMSRLSCVHQTFVRSCSDFRAFTRLSCVHVQTFVRSCPDFRAFTKLSCVHVQNFRAFTRLSCVHQTFVRSPDFRAFMSRTFVRSPNFRAFMSRTFVRSPDFRAFTRLSCVHQTFVRLCPDFRAFTRLSCVHVQTFVRSPNFRAFMSRTFVRSCPDFRAFTKLSCVHVQNFRAFTKLSCIRQTFVRSSDFRAFTRLFVRSCPDFRAFFLVSRPCKFERTTPPSCVHLGLDISTFRLGPQPGLQFGRATEKRYPEGNVEETSNKRNGKQGYSNCKNKKISPSEIHWEMREISVSGKVYCLQHTHSALYFRRLRGDRNDGA